MLERRKYKRIPENSQIFYEVIPDQKVRDYATKDISQSGFRFLAHEFIPTGSHLRIKLTFHKTLFSFEALVRCVWVREMPYSGEFEIGAEFIDIPAKAAEYIINYIKDFLDKSG